jgi:lipopolysaccharide export system protein LptA
MAVKYHHFILAALIFAMGVLEGSPSAGTNLAVGEMMFPSGIVVRVDDPAIWERRDREKSDDFITIVKPELYSRDGRRIPGTIIDNEVQTPARSLLQNRNEPLESGVNAPKDFFGLVQNRGEPMKIEGELAEPEAGGVERYGGNQSWVLVRLGSTALESHFLTVYYQRSQTTAGVPPEELRKAGLAHILMLEASDDVVLAYQEQTVAGDKAVFDIGANKVRFDGNVALTQTQNVTIGGHLLANLTTGLVLITAPRPWELPSNGLKGRFPPIFETWGGPKPKDAR